MTAAAKPLLAHAMAPLAAFFEDPAVEDVAVNAPGEAWVRRRGWERVEVPGLGACALDDIAVLAGALRGQDVGWWSPLLATEMPGPGGASVLRLQVCVPPAVPDDSVSLVWRRPGDDVFALADMHRHYRMDGWNQWGRRLDARRGASNRLLALYDAGDAPGFLAGAMREKLNVVMCAATGAGKTTLFKSLLREVDARERIVTVEDSLELVVPQPNAVRLLYKHGEAAPGAARTTAEDLIVAALRMRPDRVPVQEVRTGEAAWVYLNGAMTGHPGSPTTIHGRTPQEAFRRFFALCKSTAGGGAMGDTHLAAMIADAVDVIVPLRNQDGEFHLKEVWFKDDAARRDEPAPTLLTAG